MKTYLNITSECQGCGGAMYHGIDVIDGEITLHEIDSVDWICEGCFDERQKDIAEDFKMDEQRDRELG